MDIISHAIWSAVIFWQINPWLAALAGILPDVLAFAPLTLHQLRMREPLTRHHFGSLQEQYYKYPAHLTRWADTTYTATHSLIVTLPLIGILWMLFGVQLWMLAWPLHILIDIPLHKKDFFGTKVFWPVSHWAFDGWYWANRYVLAGNAAGILFAVLVVSV